MLAPWLAGAALPPHLPLLFPPLLAAMGSDSNEDEADAAYAVLADKLEGAQTEKEKIGILMGLSLAYAGSSRMDLLEIISPLIVDSDNIE